MPIAREPKFHTSLQAFLTHEINCAPEINKGDKQDEVVKSEERGENGRKKLVNCQKKFKTSLDLLKSCINWPKTRIDKTDTHKLLGSVVKNTFLGLN